MSHKRESFPGLFAGMSEGALVLTVNKRLARSLRGEYDAWMADVGRTVWRTPELFSFDAWMHRALGMLDEDAGLLSGPGTLWLWEKVIEMDVAGSDIALLQVSATARRVQEAHQLLMEYGGSLAGLPLSDDHLAFLRWRKGYLDACRKGGWFDLAELPVRICAAIDQGRLALPGQVFLAGFDELTPGILQLRAAMENSGIQVVELVIEADEGGSLSRVPCTDFEDEVRRAARWARQLLETGTARIGVVVVDLQQRRLLVERIFREEIDPESVLALDEQEESFSLSLGTSLAEQGLVAAALEILGTGHRLTLDAVSFLLRTPYLAGSQRESWGRARFDQRLRSTRQLGFNLSHLQTMLDEYLDSEKQPILPEFSKILSTLASSFKDGRKRFLGQWVRCFSDLLLAVGWPGERHLGSLEFQVLKAWNENLLATVVALESVSGPVDRGEAVALLRRLTRETTFQPESPAGPLQVVGLLEAAGLQFEQLWVMGMTDDRLPAPARPNPFIPVSLQVDCNMPHSGAERELAFARLVVERLALAAPTVIFSHPLKDVDVELRPSSLIAHIPESEPALAVGHAPVAAMRQSPVELQSLSDEQGPPPAEAVRASGGTTLLKDQALCPFRAFAHHRLRARAFDFPEPGLDAGTRGSLLHAVFEHFWQLTDKQEELLALNDAQLDARIGEAADDALRKFFGDEIKQPLYQIERERLCALVREWLEEVEKQRAPFSVTQIEAERTVVCGGITIGTKVDRIDQLPDGRRVIIDYKTGRIDIGDLLGERLLEPQLPVYGCEEAAEALAGVVIAGVRRGECGAKGVAADDDLLPKLPAFSGSKAAEKAGIADWPALLARWRRQLAELGDEFARGHAAVDPVEFKKSCRYCDLSGLCRIDEIATPTEENE
jgi:ATP-dependent helicase/nuclease subunit B